MFQFYINMQILNPQNNISFSAIPIGNVNRIPKVEKGIVNGCVEGIISKLDSSDRLDLEAVSQIEKNWQGHYEQLYWYFSGNFRNPAETDSFHSLEFVSDASLGKRIVGLIQHKLKNDKGNFEASLLLIKPDLIAEKKNRKFKSLGEILLGVPFQKAKEANVPAMELEFMDTNEAFYDKIFKKADVKAEKFVDSKTKTKNFLVKNEEFNKYIEYCKKNFGLNFSIS